MSSLAKYWSATGLVVLLFFADASIVLYADMAQGLFPLFAALLLVVPIGLTIYSQVMIRCPRCSNRITALVDTRDGKARGSSVPLQHCRFCGYDLR
jgi:hypothetical protein